jgi:hypothetical protein
MRNTLPRGTRVYSFCGIGRSIGFDMDSSPWVESEGVFHRRLPRVSAAQTIAFLDEQHYEYLAIDEACSREWGPDRYAQFRKSLTESPRLKTVVAKDGFLLAQLAPASPEPSAIVK